MMWMFWIGYLVGGIIWVAVNLSLWDSADLPWTPRDQRSTAARRLFLTPIWPIPAVASLWRMTLLLWRDTGWDWRDG